MQENFIKKLDQQIDKTAEDPDVRDKFEAMELEDPETTNYGKAGVKSKTKESLKIIL